MKKLLLKIYHRIVLYLYRNVFALDDLKLAVEQLTQTAKSTENTIAAQQKTLADLAANVRYLAASERRELQRQGRSSDF